MKRIFDILFSIISLILLAPLIIILSILVFIKLGRPVIFSQQRPGLNAQPFLMMKFRTMKDAVDKYNQPLPDYDRLTAFGNALRKSSLDELPSLVSVLKGDMSVVGPRPLLTSYLPLYNDQQAKRHEVRPGITGWAQVNGRNAISWIDKFEYDVWYVENQSFLLDLRIIVMTVKKVFFREGISASNHATMPEFKGDEYEV